jgi:hypothetical protein
LAFELTLAPLRRRLATMPAGFDAVSRVAPRPSKYHNAERSWKLYAAKVKALVTDFRACEKFHLSPACQEQEARREHHYQLAGSSCIATSS